MEKRKEFGIHVELFAYELWVVMRDNNGWSYVSKMFLDENVENDRLKDDGAEGTNVVDDVCLYSWTLLNLAPCFKG